MCNQGLVFHHIIGFLCFVLLFCFVCLFVRLFVCSFVCLFVLINSIFCKFFALFLCYFWPKFAKNNLNYNLPRALGACCLVRKQNKIESLRQRPKIMLRVCLSYSSLDPHLRHHDSDFRPTLSNDIYMNSFKL